MFILLRLGLHRRPNWTWPTSLTPSSPFHGHITWYDSPTNSPSDYAHIKVFSTKKKYHSLIFRYKIHIILLIYRYLQSMRLLWKSRKKYHRSIMKCHRSIIKDSTMHEKNQFRYRKKLVLTSQKDRLNIIKYQKWLILI